MVTRHFSTEQLVPAIATVLVIGVLTISAWSLVLTSGDTADQLQIDANVQQRYESIDGVNATQTTIVSQNGTVASRTTFSVVLPSRYRESPSRP